jgi:uncharacterized RmlC-like cupin family protein
MSCVRITKWKSYEGKQSLQVFEGVSVQSAGSKSLCLHVVTIPPGAHARPHLHERHESSVYLVSGEAGMWYGGGLRESMAKPRRFPVHPANVPHLPYSASATEPCVGVIARTDPNEQESVTLPEIPDPGMAPQ